MRNFIITVNGKSYEVGVEEVGASAPVQTAAPVVAKTIATAPAAKTVVANGEKVISPFPGLIKNLLVAEGATVKKDQPILVLEAMISLRASTSSMVSKSQPQLIIFRTPRSYIFSSSSSRHPSKRRSLKWAWESIILPLAAG